MRSTYYQHTSLVRVPNKILPDIRGMVFSYRKDTSDRKQRDIDTYKENMFSLQEDGTTVVRVPNAINEEVREYIDYFKIAKVRKDTDKLLEQYKTKHGIVI